MNRYIVRSCIVLIAASSLFCGCEQTRVPTPAEPVSHTGNKSDHGAGEDVTIQTIQVAGNVYMLIGRGGNIGVSVGDDGILIIDDQFAPLAGKIRAALAALSQGKLQYVLNTHYHGDHTGGNAEFAKEASIIAHDNVRKTMAAEGEPAASLPVITFDKTLTVHFNGETIRAVHFASGHTSGDSIIFFETSNVVHMGDHFFKDRFPYVDLGNGGNPVGLQENIRQVLDMLKPDTKIIPGHGTLATRSDLVRYHHMLTETIALVRKQIEAGASLDALQQKGLPSQWKSWGTGFINTQRWIETLYNGLKPGTKRPGAKKPSVNQAG